MKWALGVLTFLLAISGAEAAPRSCSYVAPLALSADAQSSLLQAACLSAGYGLEAVGGFQARQSQMIRLLPQHYDPDFLIIQAELPQAGDARLLLRQASGTGEQSYSFPRAEFERLRLAAPEDAGGGSRVETYGNGPGEELCIPVVITAWVQTALKDRVASGALLTCGGDKFMDQAYDFALALDPVCARISHDEREALRACLNLTGDHTLAARAWRASQTLAVALGSESGRGGMIAMVRAASPDVRIFDTNGAFIKEAEGWIKPWQDRSEHENLDTQPGHASAQGETATVTGEIIRTIDTLDGRYPAEKRAAFTQVWHVDDDGLMRLSEFHIGQFQ